MTTEILSEELVHDGYLKVNKLAIKEGDSTYHRELIRRGHSVCVFIYDTNTQHVLFTEQFRIGKYPQPGPLLECVAGMIDDGETPEAAAVRETLEETGLTITEQQLKNVMLSPGVLSEQTTILLVDTDLTDVDLDKVHGEEHENEAIQLKILTFEETIALFPLDAIANPIVPMMARDLWLKEI